MFTKRRKLCGEPAYGAMSHPVRAGGFYICRALKLTQQIAYTLFLSLPNTTANWGKNWSQEELAARIDASRVMIGKYERGDNLPSVEVIVNLAKAFGVSVDFLLGEGANASYDKEMVRRMDELERLPAEERKHVFHYMDLVIRDFKTKANYSLK